MSPDEMIAHGKLIIKYGESLKTGRPIRVQCGDDMSARWCDATDPKFATCYRWREKPREPRRWWVGVQSGLISSIDFAYRTNVRGVGELVEVVEVLEETQ